MEDNLNKLNLETQTSEKSLNSVLGDINSDLKSLTTEIETMNVTINTVDEKVTTLEKKSQELNSELVQLKQEHQGLEQEAENKGTEQKKLSEGLEEFQHKKNTLEAEIANREKKLAELTSSVNTLSSDVSEIKEKLLNAEEIREQKVGVIEREVEETKHMIETKTNQVKVLKHVLETDYTSDSHYDVIKVLKQPGVSTLDQLVLSSGVGKPTVEETLRDLEQKGVVKLDGGKFSVEKDFEI